MRHLGRFALLATILCALAAAGCTSGADSSNQGSSTVPNDPAFTADKLRAIGPCGLLDNDTLSSLGDPEDSSSNDFVGRPTGFDNCDIDMKDFHRNEMSVGVMVGPEATTIGSRGTLSGMPVLEQPNPDECAEQILTPDPKIGIMVDIHTHYAPCVPARKITASIINRIRSNPPKRQIPAGSLSMADPCGTADDPTVAAAVGPVSTEVRKTLYDCEWHGGPLSLSVSFSVGDARQPNDGQATPQPIDLGGVTGYQVQPDHQSCEIGWNVRPAAAAHQFELVHVEVDNLGQQPVDTCAKTLPAAKAVLTKVPKPS
ncbi:MAG TPA: hypothetical protein VGM75_18990 [Pseudonocardiaceae bacterium]